MTSSQYVDASSSSVVKHQAEQFSEINQKESLVSETMPEVQTQIDADADAEKEDPSHPGVEDTSIGGRISKLTEWVQENINTQQNVVIAFGGDGDGDEHPNGQSDGVVSGSMPVDDDEQEVPSERMETDGE